MGLPDKLLPTMLIISVLLLLILGLSTALEAGVNQHLKAAEMPTLESRFGFESIDLWGTDPVARELQRELLYRVTGSTAAGCPYCGRNNGRYNFNWFSRPASRLFVFGDSTVDPGNNVVLQHGINAVVPHYGIDHPDGITGRFTNGLTIADLLGQLLGGGVPPAYNQLSPEERATQTRGMNYGSAGCGILPQTMCPEHCYCLDRQIDFFNQTITDHKYGPWITKGAVFFISIGANDYSSYYPNQKEFNDAKDFAVFLLSELRTRLERLYQLGAREFIVKDIGPAGCNPSVRNKTGGWCDLAKNLLIMPYVNALPELLRTFRDLHGDAYLELASSHTLFSLMIDYPGDFGFKEVRKPCCEGFKEGRMACFENATTCNDRRHFMFFDGEHTSERANKYFAIMCAKNKFCTPY